jgi:hypothetical protein
MFHPLALPQHQLLPQLQTLTTGGSVMDNKGKQP